MLTPKIIHHVWPGSDPFPCKYHTWRQSWMKHHPDWTFRFWRVADFVSDVVIKQRFFNDGRFKKYPSEGHYESICDVLLSPKYSVTPKSDIMRFAILAAYGGIYTDTDMECYRPFDDLIQKHVRGPLAGLEDDRGTVCPSLIICAEHDPIIYDMALQSYRGAIKEGPERSNRSPNKITSVVPFTALLKARGIVPLDKVLFYEIRYREREKLGQKPDKRAYARHFWSGMDADGWVNGAKFK